MAAYIGSKSLGTVKRLRQFAETIKKLVNKSREELLNPRTESVVMLLLSSSIFYWEKSVFFLFLQLQLHIRSWQANAWPFLCGPSKHSNMLHSKINKSE